ncbi:hypothetical protein AKJ09_10938 [Labilithrix luteola]|uniref:Uncharacterized protein n=1 Tax=Labilithrix luteola TaxID=1391654 RepID=A0A0K1QFT4_9BACT|nr:hypothetical protein AKJ09_10938 [Labilithrix luteola]
MVHFNMDDNGMTPASTTFWRHVDIPMAAARDSCARAQKDEPFQGNARKRRFLST